MACHHTSTSVKMHILEGDLLRTGCRLKSRQGWVFTRLFLYLTNIVNHLGYRDCSIDKIVCTVLGTYIPWLKIELEAVKRKTVDIEKAMTVQAVVLKSNIARQPS